MARLSLACLLFLVGGSPASAAKLRRSLENDTPMTAGPTSAPTMAPSGYPSKVPVILDNDANYDDMGAAFYLMKNPLVDVKAWTVSYGFATRMGGVPNMQKVAKLLGYEDMPISYGEPGAMLPLTNFPLQWRVELDVFMSTTETLPDTTYPPSTLTSAQLIIKTVKESDVPVAILITGSMGNLAKAIELDPTVVDGISSVFFSGTAYGNTSDNNVYSWQMTYNGAPGGCTEDAEQYEINYPALNLTQLGYDTPSPGMGFIRPICKGIDIGEVGKTEWNVALDALAYHRVMQSLPADTPVYVMPTGGTATLTIYKDDANLWASIAAVKPEAQSKFLDAMFQQFLVAGEAKWWDMAAAVMLVDIASGFKDTEYEFCSEWINDAKTLVQLEFDAEGGFGMLYDSEWGKAADFCVASNETMIEEKYWAVVQTDGIYTYPAEPAISIPDFFFE